MEMEISTSEGNSSVDIVMVKGRVDSATAPDLEKAIQDLFEKDRYKLIIDLHDVEYMSSAGLRTLISSLKTAKNKKGNVLISRPSKRVDEVIKLAGLDAVLSIHKDVVDAMDAF